MSLYADYIRERTQKKVLETDYGFCVYQIFGKECYIEEVYVVPEKRREGYATMLGDLVGAIAKGLDCTHLTGSVCVRAPEPTRSLRGLIAAGYKILRCEPDMIYMVKEI